MSTSPRPSPLTAPSLETKGRRVLLAIQGLIALTLIAVALSPPVQTLADQNVRVHHLEHAVLLGGGGLLGVLISTVVQAAGHRLEGQRQRTIALSVLVIGPVLVMVAMIPATSAWIEGHAVVHALEHVTLIVAGGVLGFHGRLFSPALGWLSVVLVTSMAAAFAGIVLAHPQSLPSAMLAPTQPPAATAPTSGAGAQGTAGDAIAGRAAFLSNGCIGCHTLASVGATGVVGPALTHIGQTRSLPWLLVQMHDPCAPGHQLAGYSCQVMVGAVSALTDKQRRDLAAFLATQK